MRMQVSLNGTWNFQVDPKDIGEREKWYQEFGGKKVTVPHIWQRENEELLNYHGVAWYNRTFTIDTVNDTECVILHFDAVDYEAHVWVNGHFAGKHEGGFSPFEMDVTPFISSDENKLSVRVYDPKDNAEIPIGKQGTWYTRVSGIWQDVYVERRSSTYVENIWVTPNIDTQQIQVKVQLAGEILNDTTIQYNITDHIVQLDSSIDVVGTYAIKANTVEFSVGIPNAILWEPHNPHLYELSVSLCNAAVIDQKTVTFGMRKVEQKDGQILLNGHPLYLRGALDQAFYPDTIYVAPSDAYIQNEIRLAKEMGFNLLRKHIKPEIPKYLYWADRLGLLIWAEPPNYIKWTPQGRQRFQNELTAMIERDYNHPSIIIWSIYNEEWGLEWDLAEDKEKQKHVSEFYDFVKSLDATRLICDNSGWRHVKTDINDHHRYFISPDQDSAWKQDLDEYVVGEPNQNFVDGYSSNREPIVVSEFGVWGLPSIDQLKSYYKNQEPWWFTNQGEDSHQEDYKQPVTVYKNFNKYGINHTFETIEEVSVASQKRMFRANKSIIEEMRKRPSIAGYVVTEFTDIEWETNGWLDFLRNPKWGYERLKDFNGALVIIADGVKHNLWANENQSWDLIISNHDQKTFHGTITWEIPGIANGSLPVNVQGETFIRLPQAISFTVPNVAHADFYSLHICLQTNTGETIKNSEELTVTPRSVRSIAVGGKQKVYPYQMEKPFIEKLKQSGYVIVEQFVQDAIVVTETLDEHVMHWTKSGGQTVFLAEKGDDLSEKYQFTFRLLPDGESWPRASSFHYVNTNHFAGIPLHKEAGWEMDSLFPRYVVPFQDYKIGSRRRAIHVFGSPQIAEISNVIAGYFQGWLGQVGGTILTKLEGNGEITLVTWRLLESYGEHPIATQLLHSILFSKNLIPQC